MRRRDFLKAALLTPAVQLIGTEPRPVVSEYWTMPGTSMEDVICMSLGGSESRATQDAIDRIGWPGHKDVICIAATRSDGSIADFNSHTDKNHD